MTVGVVIVSYRSESTLVRCLSAIPVDLPVAVVDNASPDESVTVAKSTRRDATVIASPTNLGFGAANNLAERTLDTELVLYLNPDCYLDPGSVETMAAAFQDPSVVAVGAELRNPDGSFQTCAARELTLWAVFCEQTFLEKLFPRSRVFSPYWHPKLSEKTRVDQCIGACLMVRRGLERFDERFFLYCEDTDLCYRLSRHGIILHEPAATAVHELGVSSTADRWRSVARYNRGKELYFRLHHGVVAEVVCVLINRFGAALRILASLPLLVFPSGRAKLATFARVLLAPIREPKPSTPPRSAE